MKRMITRVLALALIALLALSGASALAEMQTVYSRAIKLQPEADETPDPSETPGPGAFAITYDGTSKDTTGTAGSGSLVDDNEGNLYADGAKVTIKAWADVSGSITAPAKQKNMQERVFAGWSTKKDAKSASSAYAPGKVITLTQDLTLYAVWLPKDSANPTSIVYHYNEGSGKTKTFKYIEGEGTTILGLTEVNSSWKETSSRIFLGWSTDEDAATAKFTPGQSVVVTGSKNHLYAVWKKSGKHLRIRKYITNKKWDKNGELILFRAGDTVRFSIVVSNTGSETLKKVVVYEALKGAKIKSGSGYKVNGDGDAVITNLEPQKSVTVYATYTVRSSDITKSRVSNTAYAYYGPDEKSDSVRIPIRHRSAQAATTTTNNTYTTLTIYADMTLRDALESVAYQYELAHPYTTVNALYGDAEDLADSLRQGARADAFIARGEEVMNALDLAQSAVDNPLRTDRIVSSTRREATENRAVLAQPAASRGTMNFATLGEALSSGKRLGISSAEDDAGRFARQILASLGLDLTALVNEGKVVVYETDDQVMAAVVTATVDGGILLGTDAKAAGVAVSDTAGAALCGQVSYPAAVLKTSGSQVESKAFLDYLAGTEARTILESRGFTAAGTK